MLGLVMGVRHDHHELSNDITTRPYGAVLIKLAAFVLPTTRPYGASCWRKH